MKVQRRDILYLAALAALAALLYFQHRSTSERLTSLENRVAAVIAGEAQDARGDLATLQYLDKRIQRVESDLLKVDAAKKGEIPKREGVR